jgi:hypothetical protein
MFWSGIYYSLFFTVCVKTTNFELQDYQWIVNWWGWRGKYYIGIFGKTEQNRENLSPVALFRGRDLNPGPPRYKRVCCPLENGLQQNPFEWNPTEPERLSESDWFLFNKTSYLYVRNTRPCRPIYAYLLPKWQTRHTCYICRLNHLILSLRIPPLISIAVRQASYKLRTHGAWNKLLLFRAFYGISRSVSFFTRIPVKN